ncbi:MAG: SDR family NAD(P)-dependent oxidoreductase [bacterium]|nr:SDR family NAD(P)-dependent oxidoreductase [bacterium]
MTETAQKAVAIVGVGAVLPDAADAQAFWKNVKGGRYSIGDVPTGRWDPDLYYDPDPKAPAKTYSKIGGWVREWPWKPLEWRLPIPPRVGESLDRTQKWAIVATREALTDYGYPERSLDRERTAVILGNAMAGDMHYETAYGISYPEFARELAAAPSFAALPEPVRRAIHGEFRGGVARRFPEITEDTMPGELANVIAGRVAALFDLHGPSFVCDAACASAMAAFDAAVEGLEENEYDVVLTGGVDANMSAASFVKFCKIGALSATGTRPYAEGADGFVMGEGAALFVLKRLADAERDGDRIYAVVRGVGGASDGKGKGITAPNPKGQRLAIERAWGRAGVDPRTVTMIEGHGTSTKVGDVVEIESMNAVFGSLGLPAGSIALGSVKSNIGHLKGAAGAAGILKATLALHEKVLPPSLGFERPNPAIDFAHSPFLVNTELRPWELPGQGTHGNGMRRAGVSAFGFGGTNFHTVLEEYVPGRIAREGRTNVTIGGFSDEAAATSAETALENPAAPAVEGRAPLRGIAMLGAASEGALVERLRAVVREAEAGRAPAPQPPAENELRAPWRLVIDYGDAAELASKAGRALKAFDGDHPGMWRALRAQGIFRGRGEPPKVAFLYTGQGSQYVNMLADLRRAEPIVEETFAEADAVMEPLLGNPLSDYVFVDAEDPAAMARAAEDLRQTEITQPSVLAADVALTRLLAAYGIEPDMVMGHSLGEYGALVAAGCLPFDQSLGAVSARGREMSRVSVADAGRMAAVFAPLEEVERVLDSIDGYAVVANINSHRQAVVGGATAAVEEAMAAFERAGHDVRQLPVSHAFHTRIVEPASEPLRRMLGDLDLEPPRIPIITNVTGAFYPMGPNVEPEMIDLLARQIASPVQFVDGLETLHEAGARIFIEVGPKRALHGFVENVLGHRDCQALFSNHPKNGGVVSFNHALCGLYAAGLGTGRSAEPVRVAATAPLVAPANRTAGPEPAYETSATIPGAGARSVAAPPASTTMAAADDRIVELGRMFADVLERGMAIYGGGNGGGRAAASVEEPVAITGAALGLPGGERVFDDSNVGRLLRGEQLIDAIPMRFRRAMVDKHITRLVKTGGGGPRFETIESPSEVIKLAGRAGALDLAAEFGYPEERLAALDVDTRLAIGVGLEALRDAGIPLVMRYKTTTTGSQLPERWGLPDALRDDTGVIFGSAFPGIDAFAQESEGFYRDRALRQRVAELESLRARFESQGTPASSLEEIDQRLAVARQELERDAYSFDRRFLFKVLSMGHSQFAELIGARGPNTQINAACATTTQAVSLAEDWIRAGRCRRVIVVAADDVTSDNVLEWFASGFLATGAAATDELVEDAAVPFDRRRHGMIVGMGAAGLVVESTEAARERGVAPIAEVLATVTANSAFHGTRLDVEHICQVMEKLVAQAESRWGVDRHAIAPECVFVSHETYTPARGGSAQAEVDALRHVFGPSAERIVVTNTKGYTGHAMAAGIEDVLAVKTLETGLVPPVPNHREIDPDLGHLKLSQGGVYPVRYALRLGAGFGSQISLTLLRRVSANGVHRAPEHLGHETRIVDREAWNAWLERISGTSSPRLEVDHRTLRVVDSPSPAVVPPPVPVPPPVEQPVVAADAEDAVAAKVLEIVSEQTGYPPDMLDLDLDMEADLGIDTVKQAETFAAIRGEWDIPRDENLQLRDYPTLQHAINFVYERRPDLEASDRTETMPAPAAETVVTPATSVAEVTSGTDAVEERILGIVSEQTGYPPDMLELDLDMEADLGIDTVKQAETFTAIRGAWDIPRDENLQLRDYPTLQHAIDFVYERRPDLVPGSPAAGALPEAPVLVAAREALESSAAGPEDTATVPRRVPIPVLRPALERTKPSGVSLETGRRVVVMADRGGVGKTLVKRLEKRGAEVLTLGDTDREALGQQLETWLAVGPIHGVYWLPALDAAGDPAALDAAGWREAVERRVKHLYLTMRALYEQIGDAGTFLVAATRLGGRHGLDAGGAVDPLGGAVTGFVKTYKRERSDALVKAVDFAPSRKTAALAECLIAETLSDPGAVEIGYAGGERWGVGLVEQAVDRHADEEPGIELGPDSVFVVTGAAGSIVSAIVAGLAASGGTFHLLDLAPEPDAGDPDLERFVTDSEGLKRDIFERLKASGERATPAAVEHRLAALERARAALAAIRAVRTAGGEAHYHSLDLRDGEAVASVIEKVGKAHGRIDVLIHAAGLEISHFLPDKQPEEFDLVFDVKADGWYHLMRAARDLRLGAAVAFSSIAGRFGNGGQADYSAANDLLAKWLSSFRSSRPATRGVTVDWTAWADIGMATRGSIPKMMALAGIDMLPPAAGIPVVRRELTEPGGGGEVVVAGGLGSLLEGWDESGGLRVDALTASGPVAREVKGLGSDGALVFETALDPAEQPFLHDHAMDGTPLFPGVMGIEAFAEAADALFPDRHVAAVEDVEFSAPFKFYRSEPRAVTVRALGTRNGDAVTAVCDLRGSRTLPTEDKPRVTTHFSGRVRLTEVPPTSAGAATSLPPAVDGEVVAPADIYRIYFHGPAYRVLDGVWRGGDGTVVGRMAASLGDNHHPPELPARMTPRLIELCFQTAGVWEIGTTGRLALPRHVDSVRVLRSPDEAQGRFHALVEPAKSGDGFDARVVDEDGTVFVELSGYRTIVVPSPLEEEKVAPLRAVMT